MVFIPGVEAFKPAGIETPGSLFQAEVLSWDPSEKKLIKKATLFSKWWALSGLTTCCTTTTAV